VNIATNYYRDAFQSVPGKEKVAPVGESKCWDNGAALADGMVCVEFWFICLLIFTRMGVMSVETLARRVGEMRIWIRARNVDIRANTTIMRQLHSWLNQVSYKRQANETPAAEDYEDDVDYREQRAIKRTRRAEENDPTYRDTMVPREIAAPEALSTRAKASSSKPATPKQNPSTTAAAQRSRPPVPTQTAVRPPPSPMDHAGPVIHLPSTFGQIQANPYTPSYQGSSTRPNVPQVSSDPISYGEAADLFRFLPFRTAWLLSNSTVQLIPRSSSIRSHLWHVQRPIHSTHTILRAMVWQGIRNCTLESIFAGSLQKLISLLCVLSQWSRFRALWLAKFLYFGE
jgi:hypothetical protein